MNVVINGKTITLTREMTLGQLIQEKCPNPKTVVAEVNQAIIKREHWPQTPIKENDQIELVTFVGGG
ncbi:MAG TPA: sulfur carrier protein ThiS [Candidatus Bathyarchaeia archaeon]|nr:sulfur carrier protein ThiS [Candidatus Bathyarchaeia archaeon]